MTKDWKRISNTCWVVKALAILFVITAHTDYTAITNPFLRMVLSRMGSVAVPLFLVVAGYFFHPDSISSFSSLLKKKATGLCLPWLICGLLVYGYTALRGFEDLSSGAAVRFLLGSGSYLYYLPVLLLLQVLFYFLRNIPKTPMLWCCLGISAISVLLSASGFTAPLLKRVYLTDYLNIFNWCGFFALGYAAQKWHPEKLILSVQKLWLPAGILWTSLLVIGYFVERKFGYFSWLGYPMELCSCILLLRLGLAFANSNWLCALGKYSFPIYLLHFPMVPIVAKFFGSYIVSLLISPLITYSVTFGVVWAISKLFARLRLNKLSAIAFGIRI